MSRSILVPERGVLRIEQRIRTARPEIGTDVSGPACIYAHVEVMRGELRYLRGHTEVVAPRRFAVVLPPFGIVQVRLDDCDVTSTAFAFRMSLNRDVVAEPMLIRRAARHPPRSMFDVADRLRAAPESVPVSRGCDASPLARRAKKILDARYAASVTIGRVSQALGVSPARLSREFKAAYGMPPVRYRHHLRVMDALMRFADGDVPVAVAQEVGFDDLSRFYKIFRKVACATPGSYRPRRSRNAKT